MATSDLGDSFLLPNQFGNVGQHVVQKRGDGFVVRRSIDVHPVDMQIKLPIGKAFPWKPVQVQGSARPEFEALLPVGAWGTLYSLSEAIRAAQRGRGSIMPHDPRLAVLKDVYQQLIVAANEAHRQGCRLGLLDPTNILFVRDEVSGITQLYLPDVGFIWKKGLSVPAHLTPTRWGAEANRCTVFEKLWYPHPTLIEAETQGSPRKETIALARMLSWVLSGQVLYEKPAKLPSNGNSAAYRSWQVLFPFLDSNSRANGVATLMQPLRGVPFWKAFTEEPLQAHEQAIKRPGRGLSRLAIVLLVLLILGVGAAFFFRDSLTDSIATKIFPPSAVPNGVCPECDLPGAFHDNLANIDGDEGSFAKLTRVLQNGEVAGEVYSVWQLDTPLETSSRDLAALRTEHFEYVIGLLREQLRALQGLKNAALAGNSEEAACIDRLARQLREAIDRTDGVVQYSEYKANGLQKDVIDEFAKVAFDYKTEFPDYLDAEREKWPKFTYHLVRGLAAAEEPVATP